MNNIIDEKVEILKALAHPARLCIAQRLHYRGKCNVTNIQTCMEMPQSTISQHLSKLKAAGIIKGIRCGLEIEYHVVNEDAIHIIEALFPCNCKESENTSNEI